MKNILLAIILLQASLVWSQTPELFMDINPNGNSAPFGLTVAGDRMFFSAETEQGNGIWVTDGTVDGTQLLKTINIGDPWSLSKHLAYETAFVELNGKWYFQGDDGQTGSELWVTDGTPSGTQLVKNINSDTFSISHWSAAVHNDKLFFAANDSIYGIELWVTDGTTMGTQLLKDINPGLASSHPQMRENNLGISLGNLLIFSANDQLHGSELWVTDGTTAGTQLLKDINPGTGYGAGFFLSPVYNDKIYFAASDEDNNTELWVTDGTPSGTQLLKDINPNNSSNPRNFYVFNGLLYFWAEESTYGRELWVTNGTTSGTQLLKDINPTGNAWDFPGGFEFNFAKYDFTEFQNKLYFAASDGVHSRELWTTDGTPEGTLMVRDICPGDCGSFPFLYGASNEQIVFSAGDGTNGTELWLSDGTTAGTVKTAPDISPNYDPLGGLFNARIFKDHFYFSANYDGNETELFRMAVSVATENISKPVSLSFFPNPVTESATLNFRLKESSALTIHLYTVTGQLIHVFAEKTFSSGDQQLGLDFSAIPKGIYFLWVGNKMDWETVKVVRQ